MLIANSIKSVIYEVFSGISVLVTDGNKFILSDGGEMFPSMYTTLDLGHLVLDVILIILLWLVSYKMIENKLDIYK